MRGLQQAGLSALRGRDGHFQRPLPAGAQRTRELVSAPRRHPHRPGRLYLKKHHVRTWSTRVRAILNAAPGDTAARIEAQHVGSLSALGIDVMRLVAYGEKLRADGMLESFLLTEELAGYMELQKFLRQRFPPASAPGGRRDPDLRQILDRVAHDCARLHAAGYNHRDFYCCHFLIKESTRGQFDIRLIDLHRVAAAALVPPAVDRQGPGATGLLGPARA